VAELNYLRIARILGATITNTGHAPRFGNFGVNRVAMERFRMEERVEKKTINPAIYPAIVKAFEKVREGYEPDRVLIDPILSKRFIRECRQRGVEASAVEINKRLQSFRKSSGYRIGIKPTTREAGIDPEPYFYAAELGYTQLGYRQHASIDDVITDPAVGNEFVKLCQAIKPSGSSMVFKWAVLCLRKMRSFTIKKTDKLLHLNPSLIENRLLFSGNLKEMNTRDLPEGGGVYSLEENNGHRNYLYIGFGDSLRESIAPFSKGKPFSSVSGPFWNPVPSEISLNCGVFPARWFGLSRRDLSFRLVEARRPIFNIPVEIERNAA
jgi:hypothetical protein